MLHLRCSSSPHSRVIFNFFLPPSFPILILISGLFSTVDSVEALTLPLTENNHFLLHWLSCFSNIAENAGSHRYPITRLTIRVVNKPFLSAIPDAAEPCLLIRSLSPESQVLFLCNTNTLPSQTCFTSRSLHLTSTHPCSECSSQKSLPESLRSRQTVETAQPLRGRLVWEEKACLEAYILNEASSRESNTALDLQENG